MEKSSFLIVGALACLMVSTGFAPVLYAEPTITVPSGFEATVVLTGSPLVHIGGLAKSEDGGLLYVSDPGQSAILVLNILSNSISTLVAGYPPFGVSGPNRMLVGDGRPLLGTDLIVADHNADTASNCCNGRIYRMDRQTGNVVAVVSVGSAGVLGGDPYGLALGPGGDFGTGLYVMDFQGVSVDAPVLFRINSDGSRSVFLMNSQLWTVDQTPTSLAFGSGDFGNNLYVADPAIPITGNPVPTIWRVTPQAQLTAFLQGAPLARPQSIRFGPGGVFGNDLYVLDAGVGSIFTVTPGGAISSFATGLPSAGSAGPELLFVQDSLFVGIGNTLIKISPKSADFSVSASPASRTIGQGQATSYDVMTTLVAGTAHPISLTVSGLPSGATATFTPATITPTGSSALFVTTAITTPSGTFAFTITGTEGGVSRSVTVALIVAPITTESFMTDSQFARTGSFDTVFTPDKATNSLKLAATNPGTYFYNKILSNSGTSTLTLTVSLQIPASISPSLPQAFLLKGSNPIKVYADLARNIDVTASAIVNPQQPISSPTTAVSGLSVTSDIPAGELRYVTVHLDFDGKGSTGFASDAGTAYRQGFRFTESLSINGIPGTIQDVTSFTGVGKRVTAIGGFALDTNLNYKSALNVRVESGATTIGQSPVTTPDGFYFVPIPAGGPYLLELFNPTTDVVIRSTVVQSVAVDEYVPTDFLNLNPADPAIEGFVFDSNFNGVSGVTVELYGAGGRLIASTTTSPGGWYAFRFTQPGKYTVRILAPEGYITGPATVTVAIKQFETLRVDFTVST